MKKKKLFPQKATIILMMKGGVILHGKGMVDATKTRDGKQGIFTSTLLLNIPKK